MTERASGLLDDAPTFANFAQIADMAAYLPVPDDWLVACADIVGSTGAIQAGRYKAVNVAGAAVIVAIYNAIGHKNLPFVFSGDGASVALPPDLADKVRTAMGSTATFIREEFRLELRVGLIPVADIRKAGLDIRLAYFAASPNVAYAMFSGGGLAWAEEQLKAGHYGVSPAPAGSQPDLSGLSCRFDAIPSQRGLILSLIARPVPQGRADGYRRTIEDVLAIVEAAQDRGRPLPADGPHFPWPSPGIDLEARMIRGRGSLFWTKLRLFASTTLIYLIFRLRLSFGGFDPAAYMADVVVNSDYRKYDDGLRMTLDCTPELADRIEARLREAAEAGDVHYGLHRQDAALMTCISHSALQRDHVHFIDGAAGGYAAASSRLKAAAA